MLRITTKRDLATQSVTDLAARHIERDRSTTIPTADAWLFPAWRTPSRIELRTASHSIASAQIDVLPLNETFEQTPKTWVRMPQSLAREVWSKALAKERRAIGGSSIAAKDSRARFDHLRRKQDESGARSEKWARFARLKETTLACAKGFRFEAFIDRATSRVVLRERTSRPPRGVADKIAPDAAAPIIQKMISESTDPVAGRQIVKGLAHAVPLDALELVARAGTTIRVMGSRSEVGTPSQKQRAMYGDAWCGIEQLCRRDDADGFFDSTADCIEIGRTNFEPSFGWRKSCAAHELMHALDKALGHDGRLLSETKEWCALFDVTKQETRAGAGSHFFPTRYAATNPAEFFAECATIFLTTKVISHESFDEVTTREVLRRANPDVYRFIKMVFEQRVPAALAAPDRSPTKMERAESDLGTDWRAREDAGKEPSDLIVLLRNLFRLAVLSGDRRVMLDASELAGRARAKLDGEAGRLVTELQAEIATRLAGRTA